MGSLYCLDWYPPGPVISAGRKSSLLKGVEGFGPPLMLFPLLTMTLTLTHQGNLNLHVFL